MAVAHGTANNILVSCATDESAGGVRVACQDLVRTLERAGRHQGQLVGRSPHMQAVHVEAPAALLGSIADVAIDSVRPNSLGGRLVPADGATRAARRASA